jgi:hypothetical protein
MEQPPRFDAVCFDCDSTLTRIEGIVLSENSIRR